MIIIINENLVKYNGISNGEKVVIEVERIEANSVYTKIYPISNSNLRGELTDIPNVFNAEEDLNFVSATYFIISKLEELGFVKDTNFVVKQSLTWNEDIEIYPVRITIDKDFVLQYLSNYITGEVAKGYPVIPLKNGTLVIYVGTILDEHKAILDSTNSAFIEE